MQYDQTISIKSLSFCQEKSMAHKKSSKTLISGRKVSMKTSACKFKVLIFLNQVKDCAKRSSDM
jgi:hypothetical protein